MGFLKKLYIRELGIPICFDWEMGSTVFSWNWEMAFIFIGNGHLEKAILSDGGPRAQDVTNDRDSV